MMKPKSVFRFVALFALVIKISFPANAADFPDAGRFLREQPKPTLVQPSDAKKRFVAPNSNPQPSEGVGPVVLVNGFAVSGATLIPDEELKAQLSDSVGQRLSFKQLQALGQRLSGYYLEKGFFARVILPEQEVRDGIIEFQIIEGKRGAISIQNSGERIRDERAVGFINKRVPEDALLSVDAMGEALNILNDQPGIQATIAVKAGEDEGDIDLVLVATEAPLANYTFGINDHGSKSTGKLQASGEAVLNNPFGLFDTLSVLTNVSEGSRYVTGNYSLPIGYSGLRWSVGASYMKYDVVEGAFAALDPHGDATTFDMKLSYPLIRQQSASLFLTVGYNYKLLKDYTSAGETGDTDVGSFMVGLSGFVADSFLGGGQSSFNVGLSAGGADLSGNAGAFAADQVGRGVDGGYSKFTFNFSRQQPLSQQWLLLVNLNAQLANTNLQSSERFTLGGISGVRGYPSGEASGDDGYVLSLNLAYQVNPQLTVLSFYDHGHVRVNHDNSVLNSTQNSYQLDGAGVAVDWALNDWVTLNLTAAAPIGTNPGRDANGNDNDGHSSDIRTYFSLNARF